MLKGLLLTLSVLALYSFGVPAAMAAGTPDPPSADTRLATERRQLIGNTLKLPPDVARHFWPLYDRYQTDLDGIRTKRRAILGMLGENYDNMSDADARQYVMDRLDLEDERTRLTRRYVLAMAKVLSPRELARFLQIEGKIKAFIDAGIEEDIPLIK
jgi:hypothetical protein